MGMLWFAVTVYSTFRDPAIPLERLLATGLFLLALAGTVAAVSHRRVDRFLQGMRDAGEKPVLLSDEMTWLADRVVKARTRKGDWRIEFSVGDKRLVLQPPGHSRPHIVQGDALEAGRVAILGPAGKSPPGWFDRVSNTAFLGVASAIGLAILFGGYAHSGGGGAGAPYAFGMTLLAFPGLPLFYPLFYLERLLAAGGRVVEMASYALLAGCGVAGWCALGLLWDRGTHRRRLHSSD